MSSEAGEPVSASEIQDNDLDLSNKPVAEEDEVEHELQNSASQSKETSPAPSLPRPETKEATPSSVTSSAIPENKTENSKKPVEIKSKINTNAVPFYPSTYVPSNTPYPLAGVAGSENAAGNGTTRPSLFLYSPSSNTMIPCEEIIIPNTVMPGSDPSNIYLAFPTDGTGQGSVKTVVEFHSETLLSLLRISIA